MYKSCQLTLSIRFSFVTERRHVHIVTHPSLISHIRTLKIVIYVGLVSTQACILPAASLLEGGACKFQGRLPLNYCQCYPRPRSPPTPNYPLLYPPRIYQAIGFDLCNMSNRALCNNVLPTLSPIAAYS